MFFCTSIEWSSQHRLKHIIEQYADGPGVLLELVQNADDAGATEISFLLDTQNYASNSVLGAVSDSTCVLPAPVPSTGLSLRSVFDVHAARAAMRHQAFAMQHISCTAGLCYA